MDSDKVCMCDGICVGDKFPDRKGRIYKVVGFATRSKQYPVIARWKDKEHRFAENYVRTMKLVKN